MPIWLILITSAIYMSGLFVLAWQGDKRADDKAFAYSPTRYALAIAVYCTSWTYFGAVGTAVEAGWQFLPIYIGPILVFFFLPDTLRRIADICTRETITSLSDFLAARYGKSRVLAAFATCAAVAGSVPYIALQLKSVGWSFQALSAGQRLPDAAPPDETVLITSLALAAFTVFFGARHADTTKHNVGLMRVLAFEAIVKIGALAAVCFLAVFLLTTNEVPTVQEAPSPFTAEMNWVRFFTTIMMAGGVIICLPRQFHIQFIERQSNADLKRARWMFPGYLAITCLMVVPIALAGMSFLPAGMSPDLYVLELPMVYANGFMPLLVFLGGFSAASGMVIVSTIALSTMVTNDLIVPTLMRFNRLSALETRGGELLLTIRRIVMLCILALAYGYYRGAGSADALAQIGLLSFAAAIQFAPALIGALYWRSGKASGAIAGLSAGMTFWLFTLFLPEVIGIETMRAFMPGGFDPQALFGVSFGDTITHGVIWSLGSNLIAYVIVSMRSGERLRDRIQAAAFVDQQIDPLTVSASVTTSQFTDATPSGLKALAARFLSPEAVDHAFEKFEEETGVTSSGDDPADWRLVQRTEKLLASALGAGSARVVMSSAVGGMDVALGDLLSILDHRTQAERFDKGMLHSMLENIPSGISVVDSEQKLVAWNQAYVELFDYPPELLQVGMPISRLIGHNLESGWIEGDPAEQARRRVEYMRSGTSHRYERESHDGRWLRITGSPMPGGGYVSIFHDITEDKFREQALLEANESLEARVEERTAELLQMAGDLDQARMDAECANASKTRFLAAASHDLLQPLNAARLFLASVDCEQESQTSGLISKADRAIQSADNLLKGLLDISRLDHGNITAQPATLMLGPLLEDLVDEATPMAEKAGLKIRIVPTSLSVSADPDFLQSVIRNFLSNARRYTKQGGVLVGARRRGDMVRIEVWDTGPGIPDAKRDILFEEFQRLDDVDNLGIRGAGLGLSVARRLAGLMGAKLGLSSWEGKGSVFSVTVPMAGMAPRRSRVAAPVKTSGARLEGVRILCVDDERTILDAMSSLLMRWGCEVQTAGSLQEAHGCGSDTGGFDALLVDYELNNGETGVDVIRALRSRLSTPDNIAIITANTGVEIETAASEQGVILLRKPVDSEELRAFLEVCRSRLPV